MPIPYSICRCNAVIVLSIPSLSLSVSLTCLHANLSVTLTPHIHLMILISAHWSVNLRPHQPLWHFSSDVHVHVQGEDINSTASATVRRCSTENVFLHCIFSTCDRELWPMTFTFEPDLDKVKLNHHAKYLGQRSFRSTVIMRAHKLTHTQWTDCATGPLKRMGHDGQHVVGSCRQTRQSYTGRVGPGRMLDSTVWSCAAL